MLLTQLQEISHALRSRSEAYRLKRLFKTVSLHCAPLDINGFREGKGGNTEQIRNSQQKRQENPALVDTVVRLDEQWRDAVYETESLKRDFNAHNKQIGQSKQRGENSDDLQSQSKAKRAKIEVALGRSQEARTMRDSALSRIGNYVHDSVPVSNDEADNEVLRSWGTPQVTGRMLSHVDIAHKLGIVDQRAGVDVAGGRGYFLKGAGLFLNQALLQYGLQFCHSRGLEAVMPPFFMRQSVMASCAQLSQFDEELYKVTGEGEDKYLVATAEQPLCAMHRDQWFEEKELPLKYVAYSSCFRKEAGSHGRDTAGIFRVHQFDKVEQFMVTSPKENASWHAFEEMAQNAEEFYQSLELPHRLVNIVSGALNNAAAKKYDLEAWFPASGAYRELVSCSNCLDYQARALNARLRPSSADLAQGKRKEFVHMLNCTLTATQRTICCILENHQTPTGVRIPQVLQPFMPKTLQFIPFQGGGKG